MKNIVALFWAVTLCVNISVAQDSTETNNRIKSRADDHAPIGVMGDHVHSVGEWMVSYRYMDMSMKGNLQKSDGITDMEIYQSYMVSPQEMTMNMHMVGVMHAPASWVTLMLMGNYSMSIMNLKMMSGMEFTTQSSGVSDTKFGGMFKLLKKSNHQIHANVMLSIPTGGVHLTDDTPMMTNAHLAYPMQTGSGTWDPTIGLTYIGKRKSLSVGTQTLFTSRMMKNKHDYNLGQKLESTAWLAVSATQSLSFSARAKFKFNSKIDGADLNFSPMVMPLFNSDNSGVRILEGLLGVNYLVTKGSLRNLRLAFEISSPFIQNVHGIQMKKEWSGVVGVQYAFGYGH
ncbi:MAG: hypothetical protein ACJAZ2_000496 [Glaciecola sp.]|jgi:hypothetical protein